jgi:protein-tyrosine phosphatase
MAESVARAMFDEAGLSATVSVESFGTAGYHEGEGADPSADAALARRGWPSGRHRARRLRRSDLDHLDLVLCADRSNRSDVVALAAPADREDRIRLLRSYDSEAGPDAAVPDPWGQDDAGFDRALDMIERACRGLVEELAGRAP